MERMSDFCTLSFFDFYKAIGHMLVGFLGVNLIAPSPYTDVILPQWRCVYDHSSSSLAQPQLALASPPLHWPTVNSSCWVLIA